MASLVAWGIRLLNPLVWRSPGHAAKKLRQFAHAEEGSVIDMRLAARHTGSPARAALYLRHADDEARHSVMFATRANQLRKEAGQTPYGPVRADTEQLFQRLGELDFLAFVHHGEQRGRQQFENYIAYFQSQDRGRDAALFSAIVTDERRHESYTGELLREVAGSEREALVAIRRVRRWELWRRWLRAGRAITTPLYAILSLILYIVVSPLTLWVRLVRPGRRGWQTSPDRDRR